MEVQPVLLLSSDEKELDDLGNLERPAGRISSVGQIEGGVLSMKRGSEFDEFYAARGPALRRTAYVIVRDWHTAEDVVSAAFVRLYLRWPRLDPVTAGAYARRAVVNEAITQAKRMRREIPAGDELPDSVMHDSTHTPLGDALAILPPAQRAVVALRFLDDLSVADVAAALQISEGSVKSQTSRGLSKLRHHHFETHNGGMRNE